MSSKSASLGIHVWTETLYFHPEADKKVKTFSHEKLKSEFKLQIEANEVMEKIWVYTHKLFQAQLTEALLFHAFVVIKTRKWWYSIEKDQEGIIIQRSTDKEAVLKLKGEERTAAPTPGSEAEGTGKFKMADLVDWLYTKCELSKKYDLLLSNCQHFSKRVFDQFAKEKQFDITQMASMYKAAAAITIRTVVGGPVGGAVAAGLAASVLQ